MAGALSMFLSKALAPHPMVVIGITLTGCVDLFAEPTRSMALSDTDVDAPAVDIGQADVAAADVGQADATIDGGVCEPQDEQCDGLDQDCDGRVDEGISPPDCGSDGVCLGVRANCMGAAGWVCADPIDLPGYEVDETRCDAIDNDCDGRIDEAQGAGMPCISALGVCARAGVVVCNGPDGARCDAIPGAPSDEVCNGVDDDCDGTVDEGEGVARDPRVTGLCRVSRRGCVRTGVTVCTPEGEGVACRVDDAPGVEVCDGLDNDCDLSVDEGCDTVEVAVGREHACSRSADGMVYCWGSDASGQVTETPATTKFLAIDSGGDVTCGIRALAGDGLQAGEVQCWGGNEQHLAGGTFARISVGPNGDVCGVAGEALEAPLGPVLCTAGDVGSPRPGDRFVDVSVGVGYACAVSQGPEVGMGPVQCWGSNGGPHQQDTPAGDFTAVVAGRQHTCALEPGGRVECWGVEGRLHPPEGFVFASLPSRAGWTHTCGLAADGQAGCWGDSSAQLYTPPAEQFSHLAVGSSRTCGVRLDGVVDCWGHGASGSLGAPTGAFDRLATGPPAPYICGRRAASDPGDPHGSVCWGHRVYSQDPALGPISALGVGDLLACTLDEAGAPSCRGYRSDELGLPDGPFAAVQCGRAQCCALGVPEREGQGASAHCWTLMDLQGPNERWVDYEVPGAFDQIRMGFAVACARTLDGALDCWSVRGLARQPTDLRPPADLGAVHDFDVGYTFGCAIVASGAPAGPLACWGADGPLLPPGDFTHLSCGMAWCCALTSEQTLRCWGWRRPPDNALARGQELPPEGQFTDVEVGTGFACALDAEGGVHCWGGIH